MQFVKYKCLHCGKFRGSHSANGLFCPINGRKNSFSPFSKTETYTPDMSKPIRYRGVYSMSTKDWPKYLSPTGRQKDELFLGPLAMGTIKVPTVMYNRLSLVNTDFSVLEKRIAQSLLVGWELNFIYGAELSPTCPARYEEFYTKIPKTKKLKPIRSTKPEVKKFYTP